MDVADQFSKLLLACRYTDADKIYLMLSPQQRKEVGDLLVDRLAADVLAQLEIRRRDG